MSAPLDYAAIAKGLRVSEAEVRHMHDILTARGMGTAKDPRIVARLMGAMLEYSREGQQGSAASPGFPQPPSDWIVYSSEVMDAYRDEQRMVLGLFGMERPLGSDSEIEPLIRDFERAHNQLVGTPADLVFPSGETGTSYAEAWSGVSESEFRDDDLWRHPSLASAMFQPLFSLARISARISDAEGITQEQAVSFLLANTPVTLPWINVSVRGASRGNRKRVTIALGSTEVRPDEVAAAYRLGLSQHVERMADVEGALGSELLSSLRQHAADAQEHSAEKDASTYSRSRITARVAAMVTFVDAWRREHHVDGEMPRGGWALVSAEFEERYRGEHKPFAPNNMKAQYRDAKYKARTRRESGNGK